jgi:monofunctional biosynthetic peptidoglycan transglycosylase
MRESQFMAKRRAVIYQNMFPKKDSLLVDSLRQLMAPPPAAAPAATVAEPVAAPVAPAAPAPAEPSAPENPE